MYKFTKSEIDYIVEMILTENPEYRENVRQDENWETYFTLQAAACIIPHEFEGYLHENGEIDQQKTPRCRVFHTTDDEVYFIFYEHSFIHIPKTGGRHMLYAYDNFQVGGNHMYANESLPNFDKYCLNFNSCYTVVRNPFSWLLSLHSHSIDGKIAGFANCRDVHGNETFESFVYNVCSLDSYEKWFPFPFGETSQLFNVNDEICAKNIMFFERYNEGVRALGLKSRDHSLVDEKEAKKDHQYFTFRESTTDYRREYTSSMIDAVKEKFRFDLDFLGYDFDGLTHDRSIISLEKQMYREDLIK